MRAQITSHDYEQLSAYIDGQLADSDRRRLEERLQAQPNLQAALDELTRTRALLRTAPRRRAPRNFTLTPAMVDTKPLRRVNTFLSLFPALSFASALAAVALVVSIAFQLLPGMGSPMLASQPAQDTAALEVAREMKTQNRVEATGAAGAEPGIMTMQEAPKEAPAAEAPPDAAAEMAASGEQVPLPALNWGEPSYATGLGSMADGRGGDGGGPGTAPGCPDGRCGGAPDTIYGMGGMGGDMGTGGVMNGPLVVPVAPAESAESTTAEQEAAPKAAQPDPSISGPGPILGVPSGEVEGQIIAQVLIQGQPDAVRVVPEAQSVEPVQAPLPQNRLLLIQILLGLLAVITGAAAFLIRSKAR